MSTDPPLDAATVARCAKVAEDLAAEIIELRVMEYPDIEIGSLMETCTTIAARIRALVPVAQQEKFP